MGGVQNGIKRRYYVIPVLFLLSVFLGIIHNKIVIKENIDKSDEDVETSGQTLLWTSSRLLMHFQDDGVYPTIMIDGENYRLYEEIDDLPENAKLYGRPILGDGVVPKSDGEMVTSTSMDGYIYVTEDKENSIFFIDDSEGQFSGCILRFILDPKTGGDP